MSNVTNDTDVNTAGEDRGEPREDVTSVTDVRGAGDNNVTGPGHHEARVQSGQPPEAAELRADAAQDKQILVPQGELVTTHGEHMMYLVTRPPAPPGRGDCAWSPGPPSDDSPAGHWPPPLPSPAHCLW